MLKLTNKLLLDRWQAALTALSSLFQGWTHFVFQGLRILGPHTTETTFSR